MGTDLQDSFIIDGQKWHFFNEEKMNPMYYRYMTTEEVNSVCNTSLSASDDEPLGEDELGFFVWNELFRRPIVVIELESSFDDEYEIQAASTNGTGPRPGAAGPLSTDEFRRTVTSNAEANDVVRDMAEKLTPFTIY